MIDLIIDKSAKLNFDVKTYDIDAAGHVNNVVYLKWIEDLRTKIFDNLCNLSKLYSDNYYPVVISTNIQYKNQIKLFDKPAGTIKITDYKYGIFTLEINILLYDKLSAFAEQKCIILDLMNSQMIRGKKIHHLITANNKVNVKI